MELKLFEDHPRVYMLGIGGSGMSGLAGILHAHGVRVSGSDAAKSPATQRLEKLGIKISDENPTHITGKIDGVITSLAIPKNHPQLVEARRRKARILTYPQAVGQLTKRLFTIAVCGTHGKTTTTALISRILIDEQFDPTVIVGSGLAELSGRNFRVGKSSLLVLEACEYREAFLEYTPRMIVMHTIDPDHLDYYKNFKNYLRAFEKFASRLPPDGYFVANLDDEDVHDILKYLQKKGFPPYNIFTYSSKYEFADYYLSKNSITIKKTGEKILLALQVPGQHNRINALAAFAVCSTFGPTPEAIAKSLAGYAGAARRFEIKGKYRGAIVIDDYGHHPAEIAATLQGAREKFPQKRLCLVFQPHQYSRTFELLSEFGPAMQQADIVVIPNIYAARDSQKDLESVSVASLISAIKKTNKKLTVLDGNGLEETTNWLRANTKKFDIILTMGAGDVTRVAEKLVSPRA